MNHIDWKRKLTSRKLWMAVAAFISGLILAFGGSESQASMIAGVILQGAAVIGYMLGEGLVDAGNKSSDFVSTTYYPVDVSTIEKSGVDD